MRARQKLGVRGSVMKNAIDKLQAKFSPECNIDTRDLTIGTCAGRLFFVECLIDKKLLSNDIVKVILDARDQFSSDAQGGKEASSSAQSGESRGDVNDTGDMQGGKKGAGGVFETLISSVLTLGKVERCDLDTAVKRVLAGFAVLAASSEKDYLAMPIQGWETRSITEPPTNSVLKGPREGFVEDLNINVSLVRRRLATPDLALKTITLGRKSQTKVVLIYLKSVASKKVISEIEGRLNSIDIDGITASYYVESLLRNNDSKLFRQIGTTEKPDIATGKILEGRVCILVDGTPIALTVPYVFLEDIQSSDDYYMHPARATFIRMLRFFGILIAIMLPGIYVALESFHYRLMPIDFLISILSSIQGISFPPLLEILFVLFLFEILNEASVRMPKYLGMALSIIGALVLGDTAVQAGVITSPSIMIVAISGITIYILPDQAPITGLLRLAFTLAGGFAGFYGILLGIIFLSGYLVSISNFGAPLMAPFAPSIKADKKDALIKTSLNQMITRPKSFPNNNRIRQAPRTKAQAEVVATHDPSIKNSILKRAQNTSRADNEIGKTPNAGNKKRNTDNKTRNVGNKKRDTGNKMRNASNKKLSGEVKDD